MADIDHLNAGKFTSAVLHSGKPVMVDFTATWCMPCKNLDPIIKQLAQDWTGKVQVYKLDVDDNSEIAMQYGVMGVPTLILFVDGKPVQRLSGFQPRDKILAKFAAHI